MAVASLLTLLAIAGAAAGVRLGKARTLSAQLSAAGGGLLAGIAMFWLLPEMANLCGWTPAMLLALAAGAVMLILDRTLAHSDHVREGVAGPLLAAAAVHSFLDGWSVRAFSGQVSTALAVPIGLAMHKIPEGAALGWVTQRWFGSIRKAVALSAVVECVTLIGAFVEPWANRSGMAEFGPWWTVTVLAVLAGSFLFLGCHALWPGWKRPRIILLFVATFAAAGLIRL